MDIVPELLENIKTSFRSKVSKDTKIRSITKKIEKGTATAEDAQEYAARLGEDLSKALTENLTADTLPDATLYYNIADRTVRPMLEQNHELVNTTAADIQKLIDEAQAIGLRSVVADFPEGRVHDLINKMCADGISLEEARKWLGGPIVNVTQSFADDYVKENAKFSAQVGLKSTVERRTTGKVCAWCAALAGNWEYGEEPGDVYRRHENCRCTVTFKRGRYRQDVHSKAEWWNVGKDPKEATKRRTAGLTDGADSATMEMRKQIGIEDAVKRDFIKRIAEYPKLLGTYEPETLKQELETMGYKVTPLSDGKLKGLPFELGGGYKVNFGSDGVLMYHPEELSHHDGAYYKISTGKKGKRRYDVDGNPKPN